MVVKYSLETLQTYSTALLDYAEKLLRNRIASLPTGEYSFNDWLDDDGFSLDPVKLQTTVSLQSDGSAKIDFSGTSPQVKGSINAVYAVTLSAVVYCFRCLLDGDAPTNAGLMRPLKLVAPEGSIVNARFPAAVSAGNVETSQRLVDVIFGALAKAAPELIPAASSGSMNNLTFGGQFQNRPFSFYETIGGGSGATAESNGTSAVHTHMTNTLNTPIEAIEREFPVRVECYSLCKNSGGDGKYRGGDGIVRRIKFLSQAQVGLISERRKFAPYGLAGGNSGKRGKNSLIREDGQKIDLPGKFNMRLEAGETVEIQTPGGGGWGSKSS
jgi:N-methylhydantoinase B